MPNDDYKPRETAGWENLPHDRTLKGSEDLVREVDLRSRGFDPKGNFAPGFSGNPGGSYKRRPFRKALIERFKENPEKLLNIIDKAIQMAENGDVSFFKELRDMLDGKPANRTAVSDDEDDAPPQEEMKAIDDRIQELLAPKPGAEGGA